MKYSDVTETINDRILDLAGTGKLLSTMASQEGRGVALEILDALHAAGYIIVEKPPPRRRSNVTTPLLSGGPPTAGAGKAR